MAEGGNRGKLHATTRTRTEKERRKRMQNLFSHLHSLLPNFPDQKVDKPTIVEEAVKYIKTLETTLESLQNHKQQTLNKRRRTSQQDLDLSLAINEPEFQTNIPPPTPASNGFRTFVSHNVVMCVAGDDAQISACCTANRKPGLLVSVAFVLDKFKLELISARVSTAAYLSTFMIHARASSCSNDPTGEEIKGAEDAFKLAAGEIALILAS